MTDDELLAELRRIRSNTSCCGCVASLVIAAILIVTGTFLAIALAL